jgi:Outer membrane protein beta-barrel domain
MGGPCFGYAIGGKYKTTETIAGVSEIKEDDINFDNPDYEDFERTDFSLQGGAALSVGFGSTRVFVDGRYLYGLTDLSDEPSNTPATNRFTINNRGLALTAGVMFGFEACYDRIPFFSIGSARSARHLSK